MKDFENILSSNEWFKSMKKNYNVKRNENYNTSVYLYNGEITLPIQKMLELSLD